MFAPALNARAAERLRLENELRSALARGELALHWQPVVRGWPPDRRKPRALARAGGRR